MKNSLFKGFELDKEGFAKEINFEDLENYQSKNILWVHFDYTKDEAIDWITSKSGVEDIAIDALLADETRPRTIVLRDNLLLALRGVNLDDDAKPEDMKSIRLYISEKLIISTSKENILSIQEIIEDLKSGIGVRSSSQFLVELTNKIIDRMDDTIEQIEDRTDYLEENIIDLKNLEFRNEILKIRRESIVLKRYLAPQKEALIKLTSEKISWIDEYQRVEIRETNDQLIRHIEELDTIRDKVILIQEELRNRLSEDINKKMYMLSILSAIFLPLTFLTGLLGINVGGIPGSSNENAFLIFIIILVCVVLLQFLLFKKNKWI